MHVGLVCLDDGTEGWASARPGAQLELLCLEPPGAAPLPTAFLRPSILRPCGAASLDTGKEKKRIRRVSARRERKLEEWRD